MSESAKKKTKKPRARVIRVRTRNQEPPGMADLQHTMAIVHRIMMEHGIDAFEPPPQAPRFPMQGRFGGAGVSIRQLLGRFVAVPRMPYVAGEVINLVEDSPPARRRNSSSAQGLYHILFYSHRIDLSH